MVGLLAGIVPGYLSIEDIKWISSGRSENEGKGVLYVECCAVVF